MSGSSPDGGEGARPPVDAFRDVDQERVVTAYHGTNIERAFNIFQEQRFKISDNPYDWIGRGIYFWPENRTRAWDWAKKRFEKQGGAAVLVVQVRLGRCLDLTRGHFHPQVQLAHFALRTEYAQAGKPLPENKNLRHDLDCAVINRAIEDFLPSTQTVLAAFREGDPLYEGSAFHTQDHLQLCVRDPSCIISRIQLDGQ